MTAASVIRIPIPDRETYIPSFGVRHKDDSLPVVGRTGKPLGFTVGEVLPERRFAIGIDGHVLSDRDFSELYVQWITWVCAPDGRIIALASVNKYYDPKLEPVPDPEDFVNKRLANGKLIPLTFDETKVEIPRGYADRRFTADGEIAHAKAASFSDRTALAKIEALRDLLADGTITEAIFTAKVSALVGGGVPPSEVLAATEHPLGFDALVPADEDEVEEMQTAAKISAGTHLAPCGRPFAQAHHMKSHRRFCKEAACAQWRKEAAYVQVEIG